jgi:hypothetical protein
LRGETSTELAKKHEDGTLQNNSLVVYGAEVSVISFFV